MSRIYDRSRTEVDWACRRRRWYNYEYDGTGIVPHETAWELYFGQTVHDGLAAIAHGVEIDRIAETAHAQILEGLSLENPTEEGREFAQEQAALIEGLLRGFYKSAWPTLIEGRTIKYVEQELVYHHGLDGRPVTDEGLYFMCKPDLVLANPDGSLLYVEYKTTSSKREGWFEKWSTAIQVHATAWVLSQEAPVEGAIVQGLYKGYPSYGKQSSPFCYAYYKQKVTNPLSPPQPTYSYTYEPGYKRIPVWELDGGVKGWIDNMPPTLLADQFPRTPVIYVKDKEVEAFFRQQSIRESEIDLARQMIAAADGDEASIATILDAAFPQNFSACSSCPYAHLCFAGVSDPLRRGYSRRKPHHDLEKHSWDLIETEKESNAKSIL